MSVHKSRASSFTTFKTPTFPLRIQAAPGRLFAVNSPGFFRHLFKNRKARKKEPSFFKPILTEEEKASEDTSTLEEREFKYFSDPFALETQPALLRVNERVGRVVFSLNEIALNVKYVTDFGTPIERISPNEVLLGARKIPVKNVANDWGLMQRSDSEDSLDEAHRGLRFLEEYGKPNEKTAVDIEHQKAKIKQEEEDRSKRAAIELKMLEEEKEKMVKLELQQKEQQKKARIARKGETEQQRKQREAKEKKEKQEQENKLQEAQEKMKEVMDRKGKEQRALKEKEERERKELEEHERAKLREMQHQIDVARHQLLQKEASQKAMEELERAMVMGAEWKMFQVPEGRRRAESAPPGKETQHKREEERKLEKNAMEFERLAQHANEKRALQEAREIQIKEQQKLEEDRKEREADELRLQEEASLLKEQRAHEEAKIIAAARELAHARAEEARKEEERLARAKEEEERIKQIHKEEQREKTARLAEENLKLAKQQELLAKEEAERAAMKEAEKLAKKELEEMKRAETKRLEVERLRAERLEAERKEAERIEAERLEAERQEIERLAAAKLEAERLEAERLEAERLEAERLEAERLEAQKLEAERLEAERLEAERLEANRLEEERKEAEREEKDRIAHEEAERRVIAESERVAMEEIERLASEALEQAALEEKLAIEGTAAVEVRRLIQEVVEQLAREGAIKQEQEKLERLAKALQDQKIKDEQERLAKLEEEIREAALERQKEEERIAKERELEADKQKRIVAMSARRPWAEQTPEERQNTLKEELAREREALERARQQGHLPHSPAVGYLPTPSYSSPSKVLVLTPKVSLMVPILGSASSLTPSPSPHKLLSRGAAASHPPYTPSQTTFEVPAQNTSQTPSQTTAQPAATTSSNNTPSYLEPPTDTFERQLGNASLDFSVLEEYNSHHKPKPTKPRALNFVDLDFSFAPSPTHAPPSVDTPPPLPPKPSNMQTISTLPRSRTKDKDEIKTSSSSVPKPTNPVSSASFNLPPVSMSRGNSITNFPPPTTPTDNPDPFNLFSTSSKAPTPHTSNFDFADPFSLTNTHPRVSPQKKPSKSELLLGEDPFDNLR